MSDAAIRLPRTAKGRRPQYFSDPAVDKLLNIVLSLVGELSVTRDRLDAIERILSKSGNLDIAALEDFEATAAEEEAREKKRADFLERVLLATRQELEQDRQSKDIPSVDELLNDMS